MEDMNEDYLKGTLYKEVDLRELPSGYKVATLHLSINEKYFNRKGERVEKPMLLAVETWDSRAAFWKKFMRTGTPVYIEGRLKNDEWKAPDGEKRSKLIITARRLTFSLGIPPVIHKLSIESE